MQKARTRCTFGATPIHHRRNIVSRIVASTVSLTLGLFLVTSWHSSALAQLTRQDRLEDFLLEKTIDRQASPQRPSRPLQRRYRSFTGESNNLTNPTYGKAGIVLARRAPAAYVDGASEPPRMGQLSAREISNKVCAQTEPVLNARGLSDMVWQWGQFLDHDIDLTETHLPLEPFPILVPSSDIWFDPDGTGLATISMFRSIYATNTGATNTRQQINEISAWIDGSNIYGSDQEHADSLRTFRDGKLLVSENATGELLPEDESGFFISGDVRVNEQLGLTSMHTLFMREHNRLCDELSQENRRWDDEEIFQEARRRVVAILQVITYREFIPSLMGDRALSNYRGYNPRVSPDIANTFSTAAFRFGHSMLPTDLLRLDNDLNVITEGNIPLAEAFFSPHLLRETGIEPHLMGLMNQQAQEIDGELTDTIRNFLFGQPGSGGFDLASLNIQRGRDHGLHNINYIRWSFGLDSVFSFAQLTSDQATRRKLFETYSGINKADPWVAMLCEDHARGSSLGETAHAVLKDQFERLRDGDRFWYEQDFVGRERRRIESTRLSDVIRRNTSLTNVRRNVFIMP